MSQDEGMFVLDVDASDLAVGAVLQQTQGDILRVTGYASHTFNTCERKYCITRKELAAIVFRLKQYLRSAKELIGQQARWLDFIEEFDFELQHRARLAHEYADALSRKYSIDDVDTRPCAQCRKREFVTEDRQQPKDACQVRGNVLAVHQKGYCDNYYEAEY